MNKLFKTDNYYVYRKHEILLLLKISKDGVRGVQSKSFYYVPLLRTTCQEKLQMDHQSKLSKNDLTKHEGTIPYVLVENFK